MTASLEADAYVPLLAQVEKHARRRSGDPAVVARGETLDWAALDRWSDGVASRLQKSGVGPGDRVGILMDQGLATAPAVLGVLKAGGAYVPLSPTDPPRRVAFVVRDTGAKALVTEGTSRGDLTEGLGGVHLLDAGDARGGALARPRPVPDDPERLAYVLYTSGSSGSPKGVMVPRRALSYYVLWHCEHLVPAMDGLRLPFTSSISFAAGVTQLWAPLVLGRTLHVLDRGILHEPDRIFRWYEAHPGFGLYCVPTLWSELLRFGERALDEGRTPIPPRAVLLSGERVAPGLVERSLDLFPGIRLWNLYGPTEATANATFTELLPGREVTIGRAIHGTRVRVLADDLDAVPPGSTGEICISGPGVARGYLNLPELTARRFVRDPETGNGRWLFRTGDLGMLDERGELRFLGRRDFQVQIRGHRVECGEVEATLSGHPAVRQAVVTARDDDGSGLRLVGYVVFRFARYASVDALRAFVEERLPPYMVPSVFVLLSDFPKLANGKVDRSRLPRPGRERPPMDYEFVPPGNVREKELIRIFEEVLGVEGLGARDDFFDLGGDSLRAASALERIREVSGVRVSYRDLFDHPSPAGLASVLDELGPEDPEGPPEAPGPTPGSTRREYPCGENQQGLWLMCRTYPDLTAYNIQFSVHFTGDLDVGILEEALGSLLREHPALRTVFAEGDGGPVARIREPEAVVVREKDGSRSRELTARDRREPFDLEEGPLYRFLLLRTGERSRRLVMTVHHLVFDGASIGVFARELLRRYRSLEAGTATTPREQGVESGQGIAYEDWVRWWRERARAAGETAEAYWRERLEGAPPVVDLPTDYARGESLSFRGGRRARRVESSLKEALAGLARDEQATLFMVLFTVFNVLLHRYTGQSDLVVGSPVANRGGAGARELVGYLANTLAFRTRIQGDETFRELLGRVREECLEAYEHQAFPFERLVKVLKPDRNPGQTPLVQVMFAFHDRLPGGPIGEGLEARVREDRAGGAKFDLTLDVQDEDGALDLTATYRAELFAPATMERFLERFVQLAGAVAEDPDRNVEDYRILSDSDREAMAAWNRTRTENDRDLGLERLVARQAARTPDRIALVEGDLKLTHRELDRRANRLAHLLVDRGVKPGEAVGIHLEPSAEMVVAILGVLRAGAAYVPLDPYYPRDRIDYVIRDSGIRTVITTEHLAEGPAEAGVEPLLLDREGAALQELPAQPPEVETNPEDLMYVMYTSGSSGRPKGVEVPRRGPANYVLWMRDRFPMTEDDRVLCRTSMNFDISVWEIFLPLVSGAGLVVALPSETEAPGALGELIRREAVTQVQFVPSALRAFVDCGELEGCPGLRRIFSGGETLTPALRDEVLRAFSGELHNLYGPTEASIYSCHWECRTDDPYRSVPIGRPIHNTTIHILDERMEPVPVGAVGEIYIGGVGVVLGYHGMPEATDAAFVPDPFREEGGHLFKTGDSGRYLPDGEIEFLGRSDRLVKVRGYRIELGEIEHHLAAHPQVKHAIIIVREDQEADVRLVAYLLYGEDEEGPAPEELRSHLRRKLPDYMIPSHFVTLDSIPLLPNDKADVSALPKPEYHKKVDSELSRHYLTDSERVLTEIWEELLDHGRFGPGDSFFDVGGHSLLIARMATLVKERLGAPVSNIDLFQFPTIRSLARHLDEKDSAQDRVASDMTRRAALGKRRRPDRPYRPGRHDQ